MHQHPRPPPVTASPASSLRTNPTRTNNPREDVPTQPTRRGPEAEGYNEDGDDGSEDSGLIAPNGPSREAVKKMDQILQVDLPSPEPGVGLTLAQNYFLKAALLILQSRIPLPVVISKDGNKRVNKWVSTVLSYPFLSRKS